MRLFYCRHMKVFSYNKKEKLKSRKQLQEIFTSGKTFTVFPVKVFFQLVDKQDNIVKAGVGVSKKNFKHAVKRNRIKRLLREVYRTEKTPLHTALSAGNKKLKIFFLYIDSALIQHSFLQQKMKVIIKKLLNEIKKSNEEIS